MDETRKTSSLTILVPGTNWQGSGGWGRENPLFSYGEGTPGQDSGFHSTKLLAWSGRNGDRYRLEGAQMLRDMIASHRFGAGDKLNILAHSHGGNVALAATQLGVAYRIDLLVTLNKPTLVGKVYSGRINNIGRFVNISARRDWTQWAGSNAKLSGEWATDRSAVNVVVDTSSSDLKPHGALIWDDRIRESWWGWLFEQTEAECEERESILSAGV
jgi:hypothetical protein